MATLRIGTCSWKYPSWQGLVYSQAKGINYLQEYAARYNTVEIDQWFWSLFGPDKIRLPEPRDVAAYRSSVPAGFRFTVKVPNSITLTHYRQASQKDPLVANPAFLSVPLFEKFLGLLEPLHDVMGPLMFQFEYLNKQKMGSQQAFEERVGAFLQQIPTTFQYGVEIRNGNYLNARYFEFLKRRRLMSVLLQGYWMPSIVEVMNRWWDSIMPTDTIVIRLQGQDREGIERASGEQWDKVVAPKQDELKGLAGLTGRILKAGSSLYINVNNHYEGSAPLTIETLRGLMGDVGKPGA